MKGPDDTTSNGAIPIEKEQLLDLTREELNALPAETSPLPIRILGADTTREEMAEACEQLREGSPKVLGFDTETKPTFKKGVYHRVALLQLSNQKRTLLIQLTQIQDKAVLEPLQQLLQSRRILKVGIAIGDDAKSLHQDHGLITNKMIDLQNLALASGIGAQSLSKIYALLFGKRIAKGQQLSDWEHHTLTEAQQNYAALDAYAGLRIYLKLRKQATKEMWQDTPLETKPPRKERKRGTAKKSKKPKKQGRQGKRDKQA